MNKSRKGAKFLALLLSASFIAASCGDDDDGDAGGATETSAEGGAPTTVVEAVDTTAGGDTTEAGDDTTAPSEAAEGGTITYGYEQEFRSFNNNTSAEGAVQNTIVLNGILPNTVVFTADAKIEVNDELMVSAEMISEDPQVIEYVVRPDAVWSDGEPIDCDDFWLPWLAGRGEYKQKNPDGSVATDPDTSAELLLFDTAGTQGWDQIESTECSADGKTITQTYSEPFPDWIGNYDPGEIVPAHVLEQQTGVPDIIAADEAKDEAALTEAAAFYNTGWVFNPGEIPEEISPSGGPFKFGTWEPGASVTLVPNENYWGTPASVDEVVVRFIPQEAQAQALQNAEIQAMDPQPNQEVLAQLQGVSDIEIVTGDQFTYEHLDFNLNQPALQDIRVREAFAECIGRQGIVDSLVKPLNPESIISNNRWIFTFEDGYQDNSDGRFVEPNIERASQLLEEAGQTGLTLRIGYRAPNQRRTDTVALIKANCDQAGFNIQDTGSETFFGVELDQGDYDVALFGWAGTPLKTGTSSQFSTGGGQNYGNYTNPEVDDLITQINRATSQEEVLDLANQIDTTLWEDLYTIPLFTFAQLAAVSNDVTGLEPNPTQYGMTWNIGDWGVI